MNFIYPSFLFALFSIAIPVVIHLFDLQRPQKIFFTNVRFLKNVNEQTSSTRKLKQLLVLLARILFITFLVLAFSQPFIDGKNKDTLAGTQFISVFVDNSMSSQSEMDGTSLFNTILKAADKIADLVTSTSLFILLDNNLEPASYQTLTKIKYKDKITEMQFSASNKKFDLIYRKQIELLNKNASTSPKRIFWISDFQKEPTNSIENLALDSSIHLYLIPVTNKKSTNVSIDSIWLENIFVRSNENNTLKVKLNLTGETQRNLKLKLFIDEVQSGNASVDLAPNSKSIVSFDFRLTNQELKKCRLELDDRPVVFDNNYFFTILPTNQISILELSDKKQPFIENVYANESTFQWKQNLFGNLSIKELALSNLIVVNGFDKLNISEMKSISDNVKKGKDVLLIPSSQPIQAGITNAIQSFNLPAINLLNNDLKSQNAIVFPEAKNPFFANVFEKVDRNLEMPYVQTLLQWGNKGLTLLNTKTNEPFISTFNLGKGKVYVMSTSLNEPFCNIQKHAIFVPLMYNLAINSINSANQLTYTFNTKRIEIPIGEKYNESNFKIVKGDFNYFPEQSIRDGKLVLSIPKTAIEPGYFDVMHKDSVVYTLALNYDPVESRMNFYSVEELKELFKGKKNVTVFENELNDTFVADFKKEHYGVSLWKYCLFASLFFLLCEILLIRYFK